MSLDEKDLQLINQLIYKNGDDIAVSIARSFERLEERVDAGEARINSRLGDVEDRIEAVRQELSDELGDVKSEVRDAYRARERAEFF